MLDGSAGPETPDGKTCYEQKVVLTEDFLPDDVKFPIEKAVIRVAPYEKTSKGANSGSFKVSE
jgi:hypothetical protein